MQKPYSILFWVKPIVLSFILVLVSACSFPGVFKLNVQQGNIVTDEMLEKLKPGMTRQQVHFVLGKPVTQNVFDSASDVYYYSYQFAGTDTETQTINIYYQENGLYERYEGEVLAVHPAF